MYLKSLELKNYRKYYYEDNKDSKKGHIITFAHSQWEEPEIKVNEKDEDNENDKVEKYISKSTSLIIGPNNSGKTTIINLLDTLQNAKAGSKNVFKHYDFNLTYLRNWYDNYISKNSLEKISAIQSNNLPFIELTVKIGIDNKDDYLANFKDVLLISEIRKQSTEESFDITITVKYECNNEKGFLSELINIQNKQIDLSNFGISEKILKKLEIDTKVNLKELQGKCKEWSDKSDNKEEKLKSICDYYQESRFRDFLLLLDQGYYSLNFYPLNSNKAAKNFSLSPLLKVKAIQANTIKDKHTLSNAYNKIVNTHSKRADLSDIDNFIDGVNIGLKGEIDKKIKPLLEDATNSMESRQNLNMNLHPNVDLGKILDHSIVYEYQEGKNYIPENQYGMGYTNLMVIIAELVEYFKKYDSEDANGAMNILCIEEPETYMHPEMQELFIKNISKAIASLISDSNSKKKDTFQIIISTHSPHILNSKIHSGNTLDNIMYLNSNRIVNIKDSEIIKDSSDSSASLEYIKRYLRLELSDIFYADAVILVEGQTEETYVRYLIDKDENLCFHHIKVYRIDGAYGFKFVPLLSLLNLKTIILTDLDLNRTEEERDKYKVIENLDNFISQNKCITTNPTIRYALNNLKDIDDTEKNAVLNERLKTKFQKDGYLKIKLEDNIDIYSQGKINNNYATSFEEAVILTNSKNNKTRILELLKEIHPKLLKEKKEDNLIEWSYFWQKKLSDSKSKFSNLIVYKSITENDPYITPPSYIKYALNSLEEYFGEENQ